DFARIGRLEGTIDAWSLFSPPLLIESLQVEHVRLYLESTDSGDDNWRFSPPEAMKEAGDTSVEEKLKLPVMVVDASITDFGLTYNNPQRLQPFQFTVTQLRATQSDTEDLNVNLIGDINETPLELKTSAGKIDNLIDFYNVSFGISGQLGEVSFDGKAQIDDLLRPGRATASLEIRGPNAEYLTNVLGLQQVTTGPLDLTATIAPAGEAMQVLLSGDFGEFTLDVTGQLANFHDLQDLDLHIAASGPNASTVASLFGNANVPADPFSIVGNVQRSGSTIDVEGFKVSVGETRFEIGGRFNNFPDPHGARMIIGIDGPDIGRFSKLLGLPGKLTGPFRLDADLTPLPDGGASVDVTATAEDIKATAVGNVTRDPSFLGTRVEATFAGPNLRTVATAVGLAAAPAKPFELKLALERVAEGAAIETATLFIADDRLSLQGLVGNKPLEADTDIQFQMTGPDFAGTLVTFGLDAETLPYVRFKASGRVVAGTEFLTLHDVKVAVGDALDYSLTADGQVSTRPKLEGSKVRIGITGTSLGALAKVAAIEGIPDLSFEAGGTVERVANGFFVQGGNVRVGSDKLTLQGLIGDKPLERDTSVRVNVHAADLKSTLKTFGIDYAELPAGEFDVSGELLNQAGGFAVKSLSASLAGAKLSANGMLGPLPDFQGTKLTGRIQGADLSRLLPDEPKYSALNKSYEVSSSVAVADQKVLLNDVKVRLDKTQLTANLGLGLSPFLGSGHFAIDGSSPDVFGLLPPAADRTISEKAPLELHAQGNWADHLWILDKFFLQVGKGNVTANGTFDGPPDFDRTDLSVDLNIASIRNLSVLAGRDLPPDSARLKFRLLGAGDMIAIEKFEGAIGDSDITGGFSYRAGDVPRIQLGFKSDRLNLAPYLSDPEKQEQPQDKPRAESEKGSDRVIPDMVIPVDLLRKYEASVDIQIAELNLRQRTLTDVGLLGTVEDAVLLVKEFNFRSSDNENLAGTIEIHAKESGAEMLLAAQGAGFRPALTGLSKDERLALPRIGLDTVLHGTGATVRELAGSLDGYTHVNAGPGKVRPNALNFLTGDFLSQVLRTINPFSKTDPYTNVKCAAVLLRITDGIITGRPAVVTQTERVNIFVAAKIDLKTEKLDVNVNTVPQKGLGLSLSDLINPYTNISGTLAKPTLTLDPQGAMIEGGVAVATGGISILAKRFAERYLTAADACGKAVSEAEPEFKTIKAFYYPEGATAQ
ncbi:MAG: hypothetical protein MUP90_18275, partial [Gammaproteobacteria bacterium]|nr:hypothetical protein [Gammaproteobacteria bacterium]